MDNKKIKIALDVDDTIIECNSYALRYLGLTNSLEEFSHWNAPIVKTVMPLYQDVNFVSSQPIIDGAKEFIDSLLKRSCEVFFVTSVPSKVATERINYLQKHFPNIPEKNIIISSRKDVIKVDILIDDAPHNIMGSIADWTILISKPWNTGISGMLSATNFNEILAMVDAILLKNTPAIKEPKILCLVGPSGAGKSDIIQTLCKTGAFEVPNIYTTSEAKRDYYVNLSREKIRDLIESGDFVENSIYSGDYYCLKRINFGKKMLVLPIDIHGAVKLKQIYKDKVAAIYVDKPRQELIKNILAKEISNDCKILRLLSLDTEEKNKALCDFTIENFNTESSAKEIIDFFVTEDEYDN